MAGQKRGATDNAEASTSAPHTKKTRFVDPSEDPANFAEQVDSALEDTSLKRKGRVKNEGYDSDSSDDGEGVVNSRKKKAADEDEDEDMFAMGDKEDKPDAESSKKKKKDEFLRLGDIEGQEFGDGSDDSDGSKEPEDEDDAERQKKAGMGFELSGFNMREEMEEGKFSSDGSYVRTFDPHGGHDRWMEGVDEKAIKMARRRKRQQEKTQREKMQAEETELEANGGKSFLEKDLLSRLRKGETVLDALQRLGAQAKKARKPLKGTGKRKDAVEMLAESPTKSVPEAAVKAPSEIDQITHLASTLMSLGETEIYSRTYEELVRSVRSSGRVEPNWEPPSADPKYEYKWDIPEADGQPGAVFGPYSDVELTGWYKAAYFGTMGEKVKLRKVGGDWGFWDDIME